MLKLFKQNNDITFSFSCGEKTSINNRAKVRFSCSFSQRIFSENVPKECGREAPNEKNTLLCLHFPPSLIRCFRRFNEVKKNQINLSFYYLKQTTRDWGGHESKWRRGKLRERER